MSIGIITDSTCDLPRIFREKYNIKLVPLSIHFGDEVYLDRVEMEPGEFFNKMKASEILPGTSQPPVGRFLEEFEGLADKYDRLISIHISAELSGTYQAASMAAGQITSTRVDVVDSASTSLGLGFLVLMSAMMADKGYSADEIVDTLDREKHNTNVFFTVNDLTYLKKGGRIGKAQAFLGSVLNFNPILRLSSDNGQILPHEKVRGNKRTRRKMIDLAQNILDETDQAWIGLIKGDIEQEFARFAGDFNRMLVNTGTTNSLLSQHISPVLGSHVGPMVYGFVIFSGNIITELGQFNELQQSKGD
ncbi:MAG: DegV family protein [Bacillota bacterium]